MNLVVTTIYMSNMMHLLLLGGDSILERLEKKKGFSNSQQGITME